MSGQRKDYRVSKKDPIGRGGCAVVYRAHRVPSGNDVAFKETLKDKYAQLRMSREIEIQTQLAHPHIMPITDHDLNCKWFTMPLADGDLRKFFATMNHQERIQMIDQVAQGLGAAHQSGHVHRDVTPGNILRLTEQGRSRYVIADWGLVRQPHGHTTAKLTTETRFIGTQGFAAPEMWIDPHAADALADVYSLGRVVAWMVTGTLPHTTQPLIPDGPWRSFVRRTTEVNPAQRIPSMDELRKLLTEVDEIQPNPTTNAVDLATKARQGDRSATLMLVEMGLDHSDDADLFIDHIIAIEPYTLTSTRPDDASRLINLMSRHLLHHD